MPLIPGEKNIIDSAAMFCRYLEKMTGPEDCDDRKRHRFSILDNRMPPYGVDCEACGDAMTLSRRHIQDEWSTASSGNNMLPWTGTKNPQIKPHHCGWIGAFCLQRPSR